MKADTSRIGKEKILIVDDAEINRCLLAEILGDTYDVLEAENGEEALEIVNREKTRIGAILLDLMMPVMDGFTFLEKLKENKKLFHKIPVLVISSETGAQNEKKCFDYGVIDFVARPFHAELVKKRVENAQLHYTYKNKLEEKVEEQTRILRNAYQTVQEQAKRLEKRNREIIEMLGTIVEFRNLESGEHIKRVKGYTEILARNYAKLYPECCLDEKSIEEMVEASALHDLGKISIPDRILSKPGKLTNEEYEYMKSHTLRGCELLDSIQIDWNPQYKNTIYEIIRYHHERFDGKGYPDHLKGDEIPLSAQIVSLADVYDALVSERCYKAAYEKDEAFHMILRGECGMFSPKITEVFRMVKKEMEEL